LIKRPNIPKKVLWIALLAAFAALVVWLHNHSLAIPHRVVSEPFSAARVSHRFVKERFSLGREAKFQDVYAARIEDLGDSVYTVISYVDNPSPSGAVLRVRYSCKLRQASDGTWYVIDIKTSQ
jgi:hypothetical protein